MFLLQWAARVARRQEQREMRRPRRNHSAAFKAKVADCRPERRRDAGRVCGEIRRSSEPDHAVEDAVAGERHERVRQRQREAVDRTRFEGIARHDRPAGAGD